MAPDGSLQLAVGDRVVYPGQGVCKVVGITERVLAGEVLKVVALAREEDGAQVLVPDSKIASVGVRRISGSDDVKAVFDYLKAASDDPELDWKVRHRSHQDKVATGGLMGIAEVVKGLQTLSELRPLPTKERERYDNARHLLVREISVGLGISDCDAEDAIDLALIPLGGVKKPRAVPLADILGAADDDLELGDMGSMDLGAMDEGETPESPEAPAEGEAQDGESEASDEDEGPKKKAGKKAPKEPKPAKPKAPRAKAEKKPEKEKAAKAAKPPKAKPAPKAPAKAKTKKK